MDIEILHIIVCKISAPFVGLTAVTYILRRNAILHKLYI